MLALRIGDPVASDQGVRGLTEAVERHAKTHRRVSPSVLLPFLVVATGRAPLPICGRLLLCFCLSCWCRRSVVTGCICRRRCCSVAFRLQLILRI